MKICCLLCYDKQDALCTTAADTVDYVMILHFQSTFLKLAIGGGSFGVCECVESMHTNNEVDIAMS